MKLNSIPVIAAATISLAAPAAWSATDCEPVEQFRSGESVGQLAARCGVSAEALLEANRADSAAQLSNRNAIAIPQNTSQADWLGRARSAVVDAGRQVNDAASAAGRSISDYLKDQPDLNREVLSLGETLGLPGVDSGPSTGPNLEAVTSGDGVLEVSASGLPGDEEVMLGWLDDGIVKPIAELRTDERGLIKTSLAWPEAIPDDVQVMFTIETTDKRLRLATDPIDQR